MIETVTIRLDDENDFRLTSHENYWALNPKELLLLSAAKCAGLTLLSFLKKDRTAVKGLELTVSGVLSTPTLMPESVFTSFNVVYNLECLEFRRVLFRSDRDPDARQILRPDADAAHDRPRRARDRRGEHRVGLRLRRSGREKRIAAAVLFFGACGLSAGRLLGVDVAGRTVARTAGVGAVGRAVVRAGLLHGAADSQPLHVLVGRDFGVDVVAQGAEKYDQPVRHNRYLK